MGMPEPGSKEWEEMADFMRADLESGMKYTKLEMVARDLVNSSLKCFDCGNIWQKVENSTGYCEECGSANVTDRDFDKEFDEWKKSYNPV